MEECIMTNAECFDYADTVLLDILRTCDTVESLEMVLELIRDKGAMALNHKKHLANFI